MSLLPWLEKYQYIPVWIAAIWPMRYLLVGIYRAGKRVQWQKTTPPTLWNRKRIFRFLIATGVSLNAAFITLFPMPLFSMRVRVTSGIISLLGLGAAIYATYDENS
jgi:hypothetical protein